MRLRFEPAGVVCPIHGSGEHRFPPTMASGLNLQFLPDWGSASEAEDDAESAGSHDGKKARITTPAAGYTQTGASNAQQLETTDNSEWNDDPEVPERATEEDSVEDSVEKASVGLGGCGFTG